MLLYDGCRAVVVVRWSPEQQIWKKFIEAVEAMGPDKLIATAGAVEWVAPEIKQRRAVYERPSCKESAHHRNDVALRNLFATYS